MIEVIIGFLAAGITQLLKKIKLPSKITPIVVLIVAVILVAGARAIGFAPDVNTVAEAIMKALGIAGAAALGYDQLKKLTTPK
jgi:hypothetical protein